MYIEIRFKINTDYGDNAKLQEALHEIVNLSEKCVGYLDEIIMPILFYNVQTGVNDKLYL